MHFARGPVYCYIEFNLSYLKNLKLLSIRVKELFEPIHFVRMLKCDYLDKQIGTVILLNVSLVSIA